MDLHFGWEPELRHRGSIQIETRSWIILLPNSQCQISHITMRGERWKWWRWPHYPSLSLCANCVQSDLCHKCNGVSLTHSWQAASCGECQRLTCNWWMQLLDLLSLFKVNGCSIQRVVWSHTCIALPWACALLLTTKNFRIPFLYVNSKQLHPRCWCLDHCLQQ